MILSNYFDSYKMNFNHYKMDFDRYEMNLAPTK